MSDRSPACGKPAAPVTEPPDGPAFEPYESPAGGWGALQATARALREQSIAIKGAKALLSMNQPDGFDCPGCAWPDPKHTSSFEFCENGAKAVAFELTERKRDAGILRRAHRQRAGRAQRLLAGGAGPADGTDALRRATRPLCADRAGTRPSPRSPRISMRWTAPNKADFYTSGRTSQRGRLPLSALRPPVRHEQFPRLLEHVPRGDQRRPARKHRHRQGHGRCSRISSTPTRSSSSARTPAPTARG